MISKRLADYAYSQKVKSECKKQDRKLILERYYFWEWCLSHGWRQMGNNQGYETIKELKIDNKLSMETSDNWKILKTYLFKSKFGGKEKYGQQL